MALLVYKVPVDQQKTEELEHRLNYLRRNRRLIDHTGNVEMSFKHRQEELIISEELLRRGA